MQHVAGGVCCEGEDAWAVCRLLPLCAALLLNVLLKVPGRSTGGRGSSGLNLVPPSIWRFDCLAGKTDNALLLDYQIAYITLKRFVF